MDGWQIDPAPTLMPNPEEYPEELWGIEDPRLTYVPELQQYAVVFKSYSRGGPGVSLALTKDFKTFERFGVIMSPDVVFWSDLLADSWSYLTECVRTGENAARIMERQGIESRWATDPEASDIFRAVMGTAPAEDYMPIARAWEFSKYRSVADLGGGGGALIAAVLDAFPNLKGMLVDRPDSLDRARSRFESEGLAARCKLVAADLCESVPPGADVYMLKHVLHGYTDDSAVSILRNCRSVLPQQGRVLVIEFVLPDVVDRADPELERRLMSDLNMLAVTAGKERCAAEWKKLLSGADFECRGIMPVVGELVSIIEAAAA